MELNNKPYANKTIAEFFNRNSEPAKLDGIVHSTPFRKINADNDAEFIGRKKLVGTDAAGNKIYEKIKDDVQFSGKAYNTSTSDASCIRGSNGFGLGNNQIATLSIWFKLNTINNCTFFHGNNDAIRLFNSGTQIRINGNVSSGGITALFDIPTIVTGQWYNLVVFLDAINENAKVWLNAVESTSSTQPQFPTPSALLRIGIYNGISSINVNGYIAHVGKWSKQLSQSEIDNLYKFKIPTDQIDFYLPLEQDNDETGVHSIVTSTNTFITENFISGDWVEQQDFPYSHLNKKGYNDYTHTKFDASKYWRSEGNFTLNDLTNTSGAGIIDNILLEFSVKWSGVNNSDDRYIISDTSSSYPLKVFKYALNGNGNNLRFFFVAKRTSDASANLESVIMNTSIEDSKWHKITVHGYRSTSNSVNLIEDIYLDGVLDISNVHEAMDGFYYHDNGEILFGSQSVGSSAGKKWDGSLKDVKYFDWSKLYTTAQIQNYLNTGLGLEGDLVAHFGFDEFRSDFKQVDKVQGLTMNLATGGTYVSSDVISEYAPLSLSSPTKDVFNKPLEFKGKLAPRGQLVNAPALLLNGVDQYLSLTNSISVAGSDRSIVFFVKIDSTARDFMYITRGGNSIIRCGDDNNELQLRGNSSGGLQNFTFSKDLRTGEWLFIVCQYRNSDASFRVLIDGEENSESWRSGANYNSFSIASLGDSNVYTFDGALALFSVVNSLIPERDLLEFIKRDYASSEITYVITEGNGVTLYDISGNDNHGTVINPILPDIWITQNVFHYSHVYGYEDLTILNGTNNYIDLGVDSKFNFNSELSVGIWFNTKSTANMGMVSKYKYSGSNRVYQLGFSAGRVVIHVSLDGTSSGSNTYLASSQDNYNDGSWHFAVFTWKGISFDLCVDGVLQSLSESSNGGSFTTSSTLVDKPTIKTLIGGLEGSSPANFFNGGLAHPRIYNVQLTQAECLELYQRGSVTNRVPVYSEEIENSTIVGTVTYTYRHPAGISSFKIKGSNQGNRFNGASDFQFPNIPEMPVDVRGQNLTKSEIEGLKYGRSILQDRSSIILFKEKVESIHFLRKAQKLILDDYTANCPSTALYRIKSDFTGNILTVVNTNTLVAQSFPFDKFGRLPESDIIEHLNGSDDGVVSQYSFQNETGGWLQSTVSQMPYIAKAGAITRDSRELPALRFDGTERMVHDSFSAFKPLSNGTKCIQILGFQVDPNEADFWIIGNTISQGQIGFQFFGDAFVADAFHFYLAAPGTSPAIQNLNIPMIMGKYNRVVNFLDGTNSVFAERLYTYVNENLTKGNVSTNSVSTNNPTTSTTTLGVFASRELKGYVNELIFLSDFDRDNMLKFSRSLIKV